MRRGLTGLLACFVAMIATADHGVILMYHHVDTGTPASTSVTPTQFRQQLDYIEDNSFTVIPLQKLLRGIYSDGEIPENAVAITFDDAYESVYREAFPELQSRGMPFTVFVATEAVDQGRDSSLSWGQLREMAASEVVAFGAHSVTHDHLLRGSEDGVSDAWVDRVSREIDDSVSRLEEALPGVSIQSFAYPFGEFSTALEEFLADRELYGLAQQSGAVGATTPTTAIPRFPMATGYDSTERLATALNARPLPVTQVEPENTLLAGAGPLPETLHFRLSAEGPYRRDALACYSATGETLAVTRDGEDVTVDLPALHPGRNKINCTAPAKEREGEFFWYARQWVVADAKGTWLTY